MLKLSGDRAAGEQAKGNEYRLGTLGTISHGRQDLVRILEIVEGSAVLQRGRGCDQRIELASYNRRKMRFPDKKTHEDNAPRSAQRLGKLVHGRIHGGLSGGSEAASTMPWARPALRPMRSCLPAPSQQQITRSAEGLPMDIRARDPDNLDGASAPVHRPSNIDIQARANLAGSTRSSTGRR